MLAKQSRYLGRWLKEDDHLSTGVGGWPGQHNDVSFSNNFPYKVIDQRQKFFGNC